MKQGWEIKKLREICDFGNGLWTGKKPPFINVGVIRNTNFTKEGELDDSDIVFLDVDQSQFSKRKLKFGDIILEKSGGGPKQPVGRVIVFNKKEGNYSFSNFTSVIRIKSSNQTDFTYLHRFLFFSYISGMTETMQSHSTGIRNLKFDEYKEIKVPLPPLPEQKSIVAIIDKSFASISKAKANAEQNLKNANQLFESYLRNVFENKDERWEQKKLGDICELIMGQSPPGESYNSNNNGVPLINGPVEFGKEPFSKTIKSKFTTKPTKYCKENDLILCVRGSTTGRINIAGFDACIGRGVAAIRYSKNQFWLNYFIFASRKKIYDLGSGATFPNVSTDILKKLFIPLPPLSEQQSIVQKLDALSAETKKLETIYQQKLNDLEELKKSILQKAFNGCLNYDSCDSYDYND